jgi:hypothetical protein
MTDKKEIQVLKALIKKEVDASLREHSKVLARTMKKILKEEVKNRINEVLAETFVARMSNPNSTSLLETMTPKQKQPQVDKEERSRQIKEDRARRREELLKKMGVADSEARMMFEDVDVSTMSGGRMSPELEGAFSDDDDEGVDISQFMRR